MQQLTFAVPMAEVSSLVLALRDQDISADISPMAHDDTGVITIDADPEALPRIREAVRALAPASSEILDS